MARAEPKARIADEMKEAIAKFKPPIIISSNGDTFTQFVCDPSSFNLPPISRVNLNNREECDIIFKLTRDYVFSVTQLRAKKLEEFKGIHPQK